MSKNKLKTKTEKTIYAPLGKDSLSEDVAAIKMKKIVEQKRQTVEMMKHSVTSKSNASKQRESRAMKTFKPVDKKHINANEENAAKKLEKYLISVSPFNDKWMVESTLSAGAYGVAFMVTDKQDGTKAVIKVSRDEVKETHKNTSEWEGFILERIYKMDPNANVVRLLDKGLLQDEDNNRLDFIAIEYCDMGVREYLKIAKSPEERKYHACQIALGSFKAVFDLHKQGILHRDIKPDNMGMIKNDGKYVSVLYDLGMARFYTDDIGRIRPPRSIVIMRGSAEWASGHTQKGRDQTRFDDLISWFYTAIEFFDPSDEPENPYPWDHCWEINTNAVRHTKTVYFPARLLLRNCPIELYPINTYLMCANRFKVPDYAFIANRVAEAMNNCKKVWEDQDYIRRNQDSQRQTGSLALDNSLVSFNDE